MCATPAKPGIKLKFLKFDVLDQFRDQFEPYHGMFGCDLSSSTSFPETLIRLPFRTAESAKISEISDTVTSPEGAMAFLKAFHAAAAECLIFLQHVQSIEFCWIPADAKPGATPSSVMQIQAPGFERQALGNGVGVLCWRVSLLSPRVGMDWCYFFWKGTIFFRSEDLGLKGNKGGNTQMLVVLCVWLIVSLKWLASSVSFQIRAEVSTNGS
ncbi:unnamed protein product [Effrenium voratum]|uniref:Sacsin/Nov domain-containing protein n=1 Tax=Effrenium voratum TaxID=2562239 RepID=A0AA36JNY6_9DINO|nr:unnamed protein product [Effrenium voratum]